MPEYARVGVVTGANKGIGLATVRQAALKYPRSPLNGGPLLIYLTARSEARGLEALESIHADSQLKSAGVLRKDGGLTDIQFFKLDIDNSQSISHFVDHLAETHPNGIDFIVNNAGIAKSFFGADAVDSDIVEDVVHCNYYGTLAVTQQIIPHIRDGGRLVNVASLAGQLTEQYSQTIKDRFLNANSLEEITQLMEDYTTAVKSHDFRDSWPGTAYEVSKAGTIGATRIIARQLAGDGSKTLVNSCCPGYCKTEMNNGSGEESPDQGAQTPLLLALGDIKGKTGEFWYHEEIVEWAV